MRFQGVSHQPRRRFDHGLKHQHTRQYRKRWKVVSQVLLREADRLDNHDPLALGQLNDFVDQSELILLIRRALPVAAA